MRILMIIDGLPGGGAEKVVLTLCEGMQKMGHDVSLFSLRNVCNYAIPDGIDYQIVERPSKAPWRKLTELSRRAAALDDAIAVSESRSGSYDLIFSNLHKTDRIVSRCKAIPPQKLWYCIHGILSTSYLGHRSGFSRWLKLRKIARVYQGKNIVAVSRAVGEDLTQQLAISPSRLAVINNPFDIESILQQAAEPLSVAGVPYIVHVGRFHPHKRHDRLLEAFAASGIPAKLVLAGTGSEDQLAKTKDLAIRLGIDDRVIFAGFQANPYPLIKHARMLVLSSDSEGFGNVLVEALLCGTPVVSTRCPGGPAEILERMGMNDALAELTADSLAAKIAATWQSPPFIDSQKLAEYDLEPVCRQYLALQEKSIR